MSPRTVWLRYAFRGDARVSGRQMSSQSVAEENAFDIPALDVHEAPLVMTITRDIPGGGRGEILRARDIPAAVTTRQVIAFRVHDGRWFRPLFGLDDATPLGVDGVGEAQDLALRHHLRWDDAPCNFAGEVNPNHGMTAREAGFVKVDAAPATEARARMSVAMSSLRVIDGTIWAETAPPLWVRDWRPGGPMSLVIPGLDQGRVADLKRFVDGKGRLHRNEGAAANVPWTVGRDAAMAILDCDRVADGDEVIEVVRPELLTDGGIDAYRCMLLDEEIGLALEDAKWSRIDPSMRVSFADAAMTAMLGATGGAEPTGAMDDTLAALAAAAARHRTHAVAWEWPLMDHFVQRCEDLVGIRSREREMAPAPETEDPDEVASFSP